MSLKAFHIVFVTISTLLAILFGLCAIRYYQMHSDPVALGVGIFSFVGAVGLAVYGRWFLKKLKDVSYL